MARRVRNSLLFAVAAAYLAWTAVPGTPSALITAYIWLRTLGTIAVLAGLPWLVRRRLGPVIDNRLARSLRVATFAGTMALIVALAESTTSQIRRPDGCGRAAQSALDRPPDALAVFVVLLAGYAAVILTVTAQRSWVTLQPSPSPQVRAWPSVSSCTRSCRWASANTRQPRGSGGQPLIPSWSSRGSCCWRPDGGGFAGWIAVPRICWPAGAGRSQDPPGSCGRHTGDGCRLAGRLHSGSGDDVADAQRKVAGAPAVPRPAPDRSGCSPSGERLFPCRLLLDLAGVPHHRARRRLPNSANCMGQSGRPRARQRTGRRRSWRSRAAPEPPMACLHDRRRPISVAVGVYIAAKILSQADTLCRP